MTGPVEWCEHSTTHDHGTWRAYEVCGCRCEECKRARRLYRKAVAVRSRTSSSRMPRGPVIRRVRLLSTGMSLQDIADRSGLPYETVRKLRYGSGHSMVQYRTWTAIEKVPVPAFCTPHPIKRNLHDATGTRRRLQGLAAIGWSLEDVSKASGLTASGLSKIRYGTHDGVAATTALAVRKATKELAKRTPPMGKNAEIVRSHAMANKWPSLWAWDDDIDDPEATPKGAKRKR